MTKNLNNSTISLVLPDKSGTIFIDSYKINNNLINIIDNFFDHYSMGGNLMKVGVTSRSFSKK